MSSLLPATGGHQIEAALFLSRTAAAPFDGLLDHLKAPGEVVVAAFLVLAEADAGAEATV